MRLARFEPESANGRTVATHRRGGRRDGRGPSTSGRRGRATGRTSVGNTESRCVEEPARARPEVRSVGSNPPADARRVSANGVWCAVACGIPGKKYPPRE